jgi:hypothetical protein
MDRIIREIVRWRPSASTDFRLPMFRNQQVVGLSPTAGSRFHPVNIEAQRRQYHAEVQRWTDGGRAAS